MKKICVVNVNWLGDAIFSTPVFRALKSVYPDAHISCLCVPRVADVLKYCTDIDEIIIYDEKGRDFFIWNKIQLIFKLRRCGFDVAFLLHRSMTRALLVFLAGIPLRIGFGKVKGLLTHPINDNNEHIHRSDYYLRVLSDYGLTVSDRRCRLTINAEAGEGDYCVFHIGGNWALKRWPVSYWTALTKKFADTKDLKLFFTGGAADKEGIDAIIHSSGINAVNLAGQTSLHESLRIFAGARLVVSADSGPLHLANSVGAKVLGIFGATRPEITGPRGMGSSEVLFKETGCNHSPCYHLNCTNNYCMQAIGVDDVWKAIQKIIA